ncbi:MAG: GntR family transcriptional regulator [Syntrophales bacterium]|nr:GntR family transcriptional regulator [Syntrophales bacterium]
MTDKQTVYDDIKEQIIQEKLQPGQWLIERELCSSYGLSRTPIREILWKLLADGFLEHELNRGFVVRKLSLEQIFEIFQTREAIEGMAARLACRKGDESFMSRLMEIREKIGQVDVEAEVSQGVALGRELHNTTVEAAHNDMMAEIYVRLKNLTALTSNITKKSHVIEKQSQEAHCKIIDALLERDGEKSERAMRDHLRDTCRQVVERFYPGMLGDIAK